MRYVLTALTIAFMFHTHDAESKVPGDIFTACSATEGYNYTFKSSPHGGGEDAGKFTEDGFDWVFFLQKKGTGYDLLFTHEITNIRFRSMSDEATVFEVFSSETSSGGLKKIFLVNNNKVIPGAEIILEAFFINIDNEGNGTFVVQKTKSDRQFDNASIFAGICTGFDEDEY